MSQMQNDTSIVDDLSPLVVQCIELREQDTEDRSIKRELSKVERKLDGIYWKRIETILAERVSVEKDTLDFTDKDRLLIDIGLLDVHLVENAGADLLRQLTAEIAAPGPMNHFYLSEWLEDRYRRFRLAQDVEQGGAETTDAATELERNRRDVLARVAGLFQKLPGISENVAEAAARGELDERILKLDQALLEHHHRRMFLHRHRLCDLRNQVLARARARARDPAQLKQLDTLDELFADEWQRRYAEYEQHAAGAEGEEDLSDLTVDKVDSEAEPGREEAVEYLISELRFARTLMPLGALAGGVARSCAVLLADGPRVTKKETAAGIALAKTCDAGYAVDPVVLIAPFKGRGIYEWDRDSLVIPLVPVESAEDAVANAVGNARMLADSLHGGGVLRKAYEEAFPGANFQQSFQADYRAWVCRVGHGQTEAMPEDRRAFFREQVGPDVSGVIAPAGLRNLGPAGRRLVRKRLEKQLAASGADAALHHRLGALLWLQEDIPAALGQMGLAAKLAPTDGEILMSLGLLLRANDEPDRARRVFEVCTQTAKDSLWGVYAADALVGRI